jgi:hypothetical protein
MLALTVSPGDYVFVYSQGRPLGAILVGDARGRGRSPLLFCGRERDFEILRPSVVAHRYGSAELERLIDDFSLQAPWNGPSHRAPGPGRDRPVDAGAQPEIGGHSATAVAPPRN